MKANYYGKWAAARKAYAEIIKHIEAGGRVAIASYTKPRVLSDARWFKCGRDGVYIARGKNWDYLFAEAIRLVD
ncbi:MAG: hypothetical protein P4L67_04545 [Candidatus Pacebacteria bacterium]|nr:hypothetical protein [Candidatus Paceibacterota bacterium]